MNEVDEKIIENERDWEESTPTEVEEIKKFSLKSRTSLYIDPELIKRLDVERSMEDSPGNGTFSRSEFIVYLLKEYFKSHGGL